MSGGLRRATERIVYTFLGWFESFGSVWQTTLVCVGVGVFEIGWPAADKHLVAVLLVSLYATFTQNGLAHGNRLTGQKVDQALATIDEVVDDVYVSTQALIRLAENEVHMQEGMVAQTEAIVAALTELREHLAAAKKPGSR